MRICLKANKVIGVLRKLKIPLHTLLLTIYKYFLRRHLEFGGVVYDIACIASFQQKHESIQYNAVLAILGVSKIDATTENDAPFIKFWRPANLQIIFRHYFKDS